MKFTETASVSRHSAITQEVSPMHSLFQRFALALLLCLALLLPALALSEVVELPIDFSPGMPIAEKWEQGKMSYDDPSIHVERDYYDSEEFGCRVYVVNIKIANATQLRTESCKGGENGFNTRHRDKDAAQMSNRVRAVVAMDGDFYGDHAGSFVLRQGVMFREITETYHDLLLIDEDGDFHVILAGNRDTEEGLGNSFPALPVTHEQLTQADGKKIINGFEFGPCIILNGEEVPCNPRSIVHQHKSQSWNPAQRICLAQVGPLEYRIVAVARFGLSVQDFSKLVMSFGDVKTAYMFDGGNSTQIAFLGRKINNSTDDSPRLLYDIIYFASAYKAD